LARTTPDAFRRRLGEASKILGSITGFLEEVANLLRQLVHVVGWLVLLISCASLLVHPHLTPEHLAVPGAGALAVLQSVIRPRRSPRAGNGVISVALPDTVGKLPSADTLLPVDLLDSGQSGGCVTDATSNDPERSSSGPKLKGHAGHRSGRWMPYRLITSEGRPWDGWETPSPGSVCSRFL